MQPCRLLLVMVRMKMKNNILISSAGRRVELVRSFQQDLKGVFPDAKVFATDMRPMLSAACQASDEYWAVPRVTDETYLDKLLDLCLNHNIGMVVPTIDTELKVLAKNRHRFECEGIHVIISSEALVADCRDKRRTADFFASIGVHSPRIYDKTQITFPCFAKPYDGSCSVGAEILWSEDQLSGKFLDDEKMMFMELVGDRYTEYSIDAYFSKKGFLKCMVPRERIEVRGGEVSKGVTRSNQVYEYLLPSCNKIAGARGCLTIQLFADLENNGFFGFEINPRFGGGFPLAYSAGAHYPSWLISEYFLQEEVAFYDEWEKDLLMLRYDGKELISGYV